MTTIVVAEDDQTILEIMGEVLEDEGFQVIPSTGEDKDAVHKIEQHRPEVVILDYQLPGMTGVEIARHIRQHEMGRHGLLPSPLPAGCSRSVPRCGPMPASPSRLPSRIF
jgi:CheY-like chemotaxis protein